MSLKTPWSHSQNNDPIAKGHSWELGAYIPLNFTQCFTLFFKWYGFWIPSHLCTVQGLSAPADPACVMSGLSSSWHCIGITYPFANSSNSQSYLCIGRTLGQQFPRETLSSFHPLHSPPLAKQKSHPALLGSRTANQRRAWWDSSMMHAGEMFVRWKLWKHDMLVFPSTRLALNMTNVFLHMGSY